MELTYQNVEKVYLACRLEETAEVSEPARGVVVKGVRNAPIFSSILLDQHKEDIIEMLDQLPVEFSHPFGNGGSFLNACIRADGQQWGEHVDVDYLLCLGLAIDKVEYNFPRDLWEMLPGGMPIFKVKK